MPQRLYLVRHGETDANLSNIIEGNNGGPFPGSHLNTSGVIQAVKLAAALREVDIDRIYVSPAKRTIETADQICLGANAKNMPLKKEVVKDLLEVNFGSLEGLRGKQAKDMFPSLFKIYREKPSQTFFPHGESIVEAYKRVSRAVDKIIVNHHFDKNILIVSHGSPLAFIFIHIFNLDLDKMYRAIWHNNCGLSIIEWENLKCAPKIICMNDISHLKIEHMKRLKTSASPFLSD